MALLEDLVATTASVLRRVGPLRRVASEIARRVPILRRVYQQSLYRNRRYVKHVNKHLEEISKILANCIEGVDHARGKNVIIIIVDCLRWRNTSMAGYKRPTTPFLASLPASGKIYTAAPQTYSSVPSILSGLYPSVHGAIVSGKIKNMGRIESLMPLRRAAVTLSELAFVLDKDFHMVTSITTAALSLKGHAFPEDVPGKAEEVLSHARKLIKKSVLEGRDFIAYVHLGDLHQPLRPPREFRDFFGEVAKLPNIERWDYYTPSSWKSPGFKLYRENRILLYDNTLRYVDHAIMSFFEWVKDLGIKDETLVVITADHGEEFWEHAEVEAKHFYHPYGRYGVDHGHTLFNELIEVPLVLAGPRLGAAEAALESGRPLSSIDILPTILDWLGVSHQLVLEGHSLLRGPPHPRRRLIAESIGYGYEKKALITERYKLLHAPGDGVAWVFDIKNDPLETAPLDDRDLVDEMARSLRRMLAHNIFMASRLPCRTARGARRRHD